MKKSLFVVVFLASLGIAAPAVAAEFTKDSIDLVEKNLAAKKAVLVDVRKESETAEGFLAGAVLLPLDVLAEGAKADGFKDVLAQQLKPEKIIYLYCAGGGQALKAAEILEKLGYDSRPLKQSFDELVKAGFVKAKLAK